MTYTVDLCAGFEKVGEATAFELTAIVRLLAVGEWQLSAPITGLECDDVETVDSVIVYDDTTPARIVFAGLVRRVGGVDGGVAREVKSDGTTIEFRGVDVYGLLAQRQVWPSPAMTPPWSSAYDTRTGVGSTCAAGYITANLGSGALAARQIPGVTVIDSGVGTSGTWTGRLQPLDEFVGRICRESGVICVATLAAPGAYRFTFRTAADLSGSLIFTDQGDLEELSRLVTPGSASFVLGAGQGELTARTFATADTGVTGLDRVEQVYENTNIVSLASLQQAVNTELVLQGVDVSVDGVLAADATQRIRYLDDYDLGDWLGVEVDHVRYASQVEGVSFSLTANRELVAPVLGRAATNDVLSIIRNVSKLESRFDSQIA